MNLKELENQFKEIDKLSKTEFIDVQFSEGENNDLEIVTKNSHQKSMAHRRTQTYPPNNQDIIQSYKNIEQSATLFRRSDKSLSNESPDHQTFENITTINFSNVSEAELEEKTKIFLEGGQLPSLNLTQIGSTKNWRVIDDYTYTARNSDLGRIEDIKSDEYKITIKKGFVFDRASIPQPLLILITKEQLSNIPPLFHDYLYRHGGDGNIHNAHVLDGVVIPSNFTFSREETDHLFLTMMEKDGVTWWRRKAAYFIVRKVSWLFWG